MARRPSGVRPSQSVDDSVITLEQLTPGATVLGIEPDGVVTVVNTEWYGTQALKLTYEDADGRSDNQLLYRSDEARLELAAAGRPWSFDGDGATYRLTAEAHRIRLAHLFDPVLAVHTSLVEPLPHQITAVYESMLPRQPLRFLLADDPGSGKTIMAGLLIKELMARGDVQRCLVVCPGSLAEQWQDELYRRFGLPFDIPTNDKLEAARTGNWFVESPLAIARLDKLARDESTQEKLQAPEAFWDLVVCDEAHKMSATFYGREVKYTKRYRLGQLLGGLTRHLLLMTATPHNGKEEDFQLFLALLDGDRFEGRFRDGVHQADASDLMRRMVKERLLTFEGKRLFPERIAKTVRYELSADEAALYASVTEYVRTEFDRAAKLQNDGRAGTVGFALTVLQRRLASSPEAIYQSLRRRRERLEARLAEFELFQRGHVAGQAFAFMDGPVLDDEALEDLEDAPEEEREEAEAAMLDRATAARSVEEFKAEIQTLRGLETIALRIRRQRTDSKWRELAGLLREVFTPEGVASGNGRVAEEGAEYDAGPTFSAAPTQKLVVFTEHRDTLEYLKGRVSTLLGSPDSVVEIHGGLRREERKKAEEAFKHDPSVRVLLATDAAGEGINLQRAHLMVNYDLPWNPNRLEQRFGRIHRIGQTEVCHLWNLVAEGTREGDVFQTLFRKLETARGALGGQVFDVLGQVMFDGRPLRELLIEAIRYGERPDVRARLDQIMTDAVDPERLRELVDRQALAPDLLDQAGVARIREQMERAEMRKLQPHYVEAFFLEAFRRLGGTVYEREPRRYEITHVPPAVRARDRAIGVGEAVLPRYERVAFEKALVAPSGQPLAAFVCPGHPLLDAVLDLTLERHRDLLRRGAVLVDDNDPGTEPRVLFTVEHAVQDGVSVREGAGRGDRRTVSERMLFVEVGPDGAARSVPYAPYLDYRPLADDDPDASAVLEHPSCAWITRDLEGQALGHAVEHAVPEHLTEVRERRQARVQKTRVAVHARLTKEISYWDHRAEQLRLKEAAGKQTRLPSGEARRRADSLEARLVARMAALDREAQLSARPPAVLGGLVVIPAGLLDQMTGRPPRMVQTPDTQASAARARALVMQAERELGFVPRDREFEKLGYDVESRDPKTGRLRFIEVKGRVTEADTITVTKNEILFSLNKPDDYILAIAEYLPDGGHRLHYVRRPFRREPDFGVTDVRYSMAEMIARAEPPS